MTPTTTSVNVSPLQTTYGLSVQITPSVQGVSVGGSPTGTVLIFSGMMLLGSVSVNGTLTITLDSLALTNPFAGIYNPGIALPHAITAAYLGDSNFYGSTSDPVFVEIDPDSTTTVLSASATSVLYSQQVTLTANVTSTNGELVRSNGVLFYDSQPILYDPYFPPSPHALTLAVDCSATDTTITVQASPSYPVGQIPVVANGGFSIKIDKELMQSQGMVSQGGGQYVIKVVRDLNLLFPVPTHSAGAQLYQYLSITGPGLTLNPLPNTCVFRGQASALTMLYTSVGIGNPFFILGTHHVFAVYGPGGDYKMLPSTSDMVDITVSIVPTVTTFLGQIRPNIWAASVVALLPVTVVPTGTVTFSLSNGGHQAGALGIDGIALISLPSNVSATGASYFGNIFFAPS